MGCPACAVDNPNAWFARGAQHAWHDGIFERDWRARGQKNDDPPALGASQYFGAADDAGVPLSPDPEPYHDCNNDDGGWPRSEGLAGCTALGDLRERGSHCDVRTRGAFGDGAADVAANDSGGFTISEILGESDDGPHDKNAGRRACTRVIPVLRHQLRDRQGIRTRGASIDNGAADVATNDSDGFGSSEVLGDSEDAPRGENAGRRARSPLVPALRHELRDRCSVRTRGVSIDGAVDVAANDSGGFGSSEVLDDSKNDPNDENVWHHSRSRVAPGLRDELRDPRCVATWTWAVGGDGDVHTFTVGVVCRSCFHSAGIFLRGCR